MEYFQKILSVYKIHPVETILITLALGSTVVAIYMYTLQPAESVSQDVLSVSAEVEPTATPTTEYWYVDVSGAVKKPNVYKVTPGARIDDVIEMAGGLTDIADSVYVSRNYNMAKLLTDQEKIYIPSTTDIANGDFIETPRVLEYLQPIEINTPEKTDETSTTGNSTLTISINNSTNEQLEALPGIGPVTAQKIIDNRPYSATDELVSKKILSTSVFEKIKDLVEL